MHKIPEQHVRTYFNFTTELFFDGMCLDHFFPHFYCSDNTKYFSDLRWRQE